MKPDFDVGIVGSGFGGALLAMIARRLGLSVALLERGSHPRFAIGESTSPLMNLILEQLADSYDLPGVKALTTWGEWQRSHPEIIGGLKRGFTYFKHDVDSRYSVNRDRGNQLLVTASPSDEFSDTHWLRSSVDHFLVNEAIAQGVEYIDRVTLDSMEWRGGRARLRGNRLNVPVGISAGFVVDASGPQGFLSRQLKLAHPGFDGYPGTQSLYSHFINVHRCDEMPDYETGEPPPYPLDDAALHHIFDGGWMWVLRFKNGVTSAGIAVTDDLATGLRLADGEPAWNRFLNRFPSIGAQFSAAQSIREFTWMPRMAYRASAAAGEGWALLPSAASFIDPLFSTGMPLTLLGVERLAAILRDGIGGAQLGKHLAAYNEATLAEADHTSRYIASCYQAFARFELFTSYSMFYFAAASYSEMARRLKRGHPGRRFLASDHQSFETAKLELGRCLLAKTEVDAKVFRRDVARGIECLNIAGLCDDLKGNWYDIDFADIIRASDKLEMTADEVRAALETASWARYT